MLNYRAIALVRSCALAPVLSLVLFSLTSCKTPQSQPPNPSRTKKSAAASQSSI
ncbi:MAG: hypothetical protein RIE73_03965 [Coleofasciculus sp. C1-SOL-03]|uniref:hypothetical protein n=1 Tax=Coleofasciculus sp. C1-SOL-03 TaxID=3069522 RepID=UPI0032FE669B